MAARSYPSASSNLLSFRNKIRNSDFSVWQRGTGTIPAIGTVSFYSGHTADGWRLDVSSGNLLSYHARGQSNPGTSDARYSSICSVQGTSTTGHYYRMSQRIEGVDTLQGKRVTLSFDAGYDVGAGNIGIELVQNFGTGGSPSAEVSPTIVLVVPVDATHKRRSISFTIPSITGKTRGTNFDDYLQINFWMSAGSTFNANASSIGIQNGNFTFGRVQLEEGVATPYEQLPYGVTRDWCERYLQVFKNADGNAPVMVRPYSGQNNYYGFIPWRTPPARIVVTGPGEVTSLALSGAVAPGFFYVRRNTANLVHKPVIRWDSQGSLAHSASQQGIELVLAPSVDDTGQWSCYMHGYDLAYGCEL